MTFQVDPAKLDVYHKSLTDLAGQTDTAKNYVGKHLNLSLWEKGLVGQGLWATAISRMGEARDAINANLDRLKELSNGSAGELGKSAAMYRRTDRASAERLDNTY